MLFALITVAILLLRPSLAYIQSPGSLIEAGFAAAKTGLRAGAQRRLRVAVSSRIYDCRNILSPDMHLPAQVRKETNSSPVALTGRGLLRTIKAKMPKLTWDATLRVFHRDCCMARAAQVTGGAGLRPDVLRAVQPWLRGGYLDGSGSGDPADNKHGTSSPSFGRSVPTSSLLSRLNLHSDRTIKLTRPLRESVVQSDPSLHALVTFRGRADA